MMTDKAKNARVIAIHSKIHHDLKVYAAVNGLSIAEVAEYAIIDYIKKEKQNG
tara:strand:+ start:395 stop:553 length:159 start_codon:yes stop_codon:yes gene_type:complete